MEMVILIAEDDEMLRELIGDILRKQQYQVIEAADGQEALDLFYEHPEIDLVILDIMMPVYDGWEVLEELRKASEIPIMMLTALGDVKSEVTGLRSGADDYISKPFEFDIFLARIETLLRKRKKEIQNILRFGDLLIDQERHLVTVGENDILLSNKEYQLLIFFTNNAGIVLTREQLINKIWGYDFDGDLRTIDTHIKTLRAKLLTCGAFIQTVRGYGYRFEVPGMDEENPLDTVSGGIE